MATIKEIAQEAGISVGTVSNVLNDPSVVSKETLERVLEVMHKHDYRPSAIARSLATGRTGTYGLIVSSILNPFTGGLVQGASEAARDLGCGLLMTPAAHDGRDVPTHFDTLIHQWVDGIFLASQPLASETYRQLEFGSTPVVIMDAVFDNGHQEMDNIIGLVGFDWEQAGYLAAKHLIDLGHQRIAYVGGIRGRSSTVLRENGVKRAFVEAGLPYDPCLRVEGNYLVESGFQCSLELLERPDPPTALVMANDMMALGAYQAAAQLGLSIPEDVSVVGIDDNFFVAYLAPPLTTVRVPSRELGRLGLNMLLKSPDIGPAPQRLLLPTSLIVRNSTAPYRG